MIYTLENDTVKITIDSIGAELKSITGKKENTEFLWNSDPKYWKSSAPVLFPIIGELNEGKYRIDGNIYKLPRHGMVRPLEFILVHQTENEIIMALNYTDDTLSIYPFRFCLQMIYTLGESLVKVGTKVINLDDKDILFSFGTHPAFMCPIEKGESLADCYLQFDEKETCDVAFLNAEGFYPKEKTKFLDHTDILLLSEGLFANYAMILTELKSNNVTLHSRKSMKKLKIDFTQFPNLCLWQPVGGAPFLCIEPWFGHSDYQEYKGEFKDKEGIISLAKKKEFIFNYIIYFCE